MAYNSLSELFKATADAIRSKTGSTDSIVANDFPLAIAAIPTGSGGDPAIPDEDWIGDGNTHIWITLHEGRTSPMLGVCPKGTVTVDWGDGTTPDTLTGTSTFVVQWTPTHNYAASGDYVITLTVNGEMGVSGLSGTNQNSYILRHSSSATGINIAYQSAVNKIELGTGVKNIDSSAFAGCYSLTSINIPDGVTSISSTAFYNCRALTSINIPDSVMDVGPYAFTNCSSLTSINIPDSVTDVGTYAFAACYSLTSINIPDSVTNVGTYAFNNCYSLVSINISNGVTSIASGAFQNCYSLVSINIPDSLMSIGDSAFNNCYGVRFYDFSNYTVVPTLSSTNAFTNIPADCEIRVPAALYDEWIAAEIWATYAS
jgi:hypothetical protein